VVCHSFHLRPFVRVRCSMHGHTAAERVGRAFAAGRRARRCSRTMLRSAKICSIRSSFMCTRSSTCEHGVRPDRLRATMLLISARRKPKRRAWITNASSDNVPLS
jgi:hypothetical protein